jgi:NAD(P)-dependent dehydrogenase (short-subunit alcohol dehydrogenase family)
MKLESKVCLIAGASGALGSAVAQAFVREGARLAITYHSRQPKDLLRKLEISGPTDTTSFSLDVARWQDVEQVVAAVHQQFGRIDALVNCTGSYGPIGPTQTVNAEEWAEAIQTNLIGAFHLVHAVLPVMLAQRSGSIINFSGGGAAYGRPYFTAYGASKAALVRFTESVAAEVSQCNVRLNAIAPGAVKSRMWEQLRNAGAVAGERALKELEEMDAHGGVGPERAAALAVFLASDHSKDISGRLISAVHDDWENVERDLPKLLQSDAWTLRRVRLG